MSDILKIASQHSEWLAARRTTIASNVANANTPGYQVQDVIAFSDMLKSAGATTRLVATHQNHVGGVADSSREVERIGRSTRETHHSGNNVNLDEEMMKAGQIGQQQALNAGIVKAFHRLLLASAKG